MGNGANRTICNYIFLRGFILYNIMKCEHCPLKDTNMPCVGDDLGHKPACDGVNPGHPKYNPNMANTVVTHSTDLYNKKNNPHLIPPPTFAQKVFNLGGAITRIVSEGYKEVDDDVYRARLSQCEKCEFRTPEWVCSHPSCGCYLSKKAVLSTESCPIGKWGFEFMKDDEEINKIRSVAVDQMMKEAVIIEAGKPGGAGCGGCGSAKVAPQK